MLFGVLVGASAGEMCRRAQGCRSFSTILQSTACPEARARCAQSNVACVSEIPAGPVGPTAPSRTAVVAAAIDLFAANGFEATSVDEIARATGMSRSTFFRQFGGKDDVIFADHEVLIKRLRAFLDAGHPDPWLAVCEATKLVFRHFSAEPELARRRYQVVRQTPALRDREIVTVFRYSRLFDEYLRREVPGLDPLDAVGFTALVTAAHNHVLRRLLRGGRAVPMSALQSALDDAMRRFGVGAPGERDTAAEEQIVVAVFPRSMPRAEVARRLGESI